MHGVVLHCVAYVSAPSCVQKWAASNADTGTTMVRKDEDGETPPAPREMEWTAKLASFKQVPPTIMGADGAPSPFFPPSRSAGGTRSGEGLILWVNLIILPRGYA